MKIIWYLLAFMLIIMFIIMCYGVCSIVTYLASLGQMGWIIILLCIIIISIFFGEILERTEE